MREKNHLAHSKAMTLKSFESFLFFLRYTVHRWIVNCGCTHFSHGMGKGCEVHPVDLKSLKCPCSAFSLPFT